MTSLHPEEGVSLLLTSSVRVLTTSQIARTWFLGKPSPLGSARRLVKRLVRAGEVCQSVEMLPPEIDVRTPLLEWNPGSDNLPDLGRLSWQARSRFQATPNRTQLVRHATTRPLRKTELMHDVLVSQVFLNLIQRDPSNFLAWTPEDDVPPDACFRYGNRLPDGVLTGPGGEVLIECIAAYDKRRLAATFEAWKHLPFRFY